MLFWDRATSLFVAASLFLGWSPLHRFFDSCRGTVRLSLVFFLTIALLQISAWAAQAAWVPAGPDGGDARSLTAVPGDPSHLFLGGTNSLIYESTDGGVSWRRLAKLDTTDDLVIDHIVVDAADPMRMYAAAWKFDHPDGGFWISSNGGKDWTEAPG